MLQVDSRPRYRIFRIDRNYDDLIASQRQVDEDNNEDQKLFMEVLNRLEEKDRKKVHTVLQVTALIESSSCIEDEEKRTNVGGDYYKTFAGIYPAVQRQYEQFLKKFNKDDQAALMKMVDKTKTTAFETCQSLYNAG